MSCKTAVLAITNGGSKEIITHEHDGLLCTAETFPRELVRLISNNALRESLMENALQTAKKYNIDSLALSYMKTYSSCCGKTDE
jgi:glycosyltransferase involved in cell wall biosynthesis